MTDVLTLLASLALITWCECTRPSRAHCPSSWWLNGVRRNGVYECRPDDETERAVRGVVYCTGGSRPIVVDERTVACQREGWR